MMSSSTIKVVQRVNIQRAIDKKALIEKYGTRGKLIKLVQNRSKLSTQIDETLNHHVERFKFNGPAEILKSNSTITEELRIKLAKLKQPKETRKTALTRAHHLTNYLSNYIINMFQSGYIGSELNSKYPMFQISRVSLDADLKSLEISWLTTSDEKSNEDIEKNYLSRLVGQIRHDIISNRVIGYMPPVVFIRDNSKMVLDQLENLLKISKINKFENINKPKEEKTKAKTVNNVYGIDHDKLIKQIKPEATQIEKVVKEEEKVDLKKKYDLTLKAMKINQKIKKEKINKSALLRLTISELAISQREANKQKNDDDEYDDDDY